MKNMAKLMMTIICILILISGFIFIYNMERSSNISFAASSSSSDLQLMARAINGEARGEPYEGQVAVRSSYIKSCKKLAISKYNSRSNI